MHACIHIRHIEEREGERGCRKPAQCLDLGRVQDTELPRAFLEQRFTLITLIVDKMLVAHYRHSSDHDQTAGSNP